MKRTKLKPVNRKRRQSEFCRCYHSRARVAWVKSLHCVWCGVAGCDNAHTETDGMGRKAGYETIVPLCRRCHSAFDEFRWPLDNPAHREFLRWSAPKVQAAWLLVEGAA